jgi:hypothetical protein
MGCILLLSKVMIASSASYAAFLAMTEVAGRPAVAMTEVVGRPAVAMTEKCRLCEERSDAAAQKALYGSISLYCKEHFL